MPNFEELEPVERVLVVVAHPDDVDFGSAGTVAKWVSEGSIVAYCIITDGDAGGFDPGIARTEMPSIRQREQTNAAGILGVADLTFLGYRDGELQATIGLRKDIARKIRQFRPNRVICQSTERNFDRIYASHPDHLAAAEATICAVYPDARNPFAFPELLAENLEAHTVQDVIMQASPNPNCYTDITDYVDNKIRAILEHKSQLSNPGETAAFVRGWVEASGAEVGLPKGRFAETYRRVITG
ncbi:MAG: PIG-L family deacetylase [Candidatus Marsarchaeota archaeon]|nr:PIG-L family deacetylase [Candidatus Marsarchaeota archaeon]